MRRDPQPGDWFLTEIGGHHIKAFVDLGQWWCKKPSRYSHAGMVMDGGLVLEAMPGGAILSPLTKYTSDLRSVTTFSRWDIDDATRARLVLEAWQYAPRDGRLGVGYSWPTYGAIGLHSRGNDAAWLRDYIKKTGQQICSQLVDQINFDAGVTLFDDGRWQGYVMPADLDYALEGPVGR